MGPLNKGGTLLPSPLTKKEPEVSTRYSQADSVAIEYHYTKQVYLEHVPETTGCTEYTYSTLLYIPDTYSTCF